MEHTYKGHNIFLAPNQKVFFVEKTESNKENPYTIINQNALRKAMNILGVGYKTPAPFIMWCYLAKNKPNTPLFLSSAAFENYTGLSRKSYDHALKVLIEKGYIKNDKKSVYIFNEAGF